MSQKLLQLGALYGTADRGQGENKKNLFFCELLLFVNLDIENL